jgi:hypothetical protein
MRKCEHTLTITGPPYYEHTHFPSSTTDGKVCSNFLIKGSVQPKKQEETAVYKLTAQRVVQNLN